jgi:mannitol 2-dehydrogenase
MKLNAHNLPALNVPVPAYDRSQTSIGIVHFGVGGFHRAHQAMYIDRLLSQGLARDWGICGVGVLPGDQRMRDALHGQDHLYTLILEHPDGTREPRVIGSIVDFRYAPDDPEAVIELIAAPTTRIISLTITEGGYNEPLSAVFGLVTEELDRRRQRGIASPTIVSCHNIV